MSLPVPGYSDQLRPVPTTANVCFVYQWIDISDHRRGCGGDLNHPAGAPDGSYTSQHASP
ncbi:hypothetical protein FMEAI12_4210017 [Parafrankia sp. Ea1.12]|nr:hypothetical protein FMEAI12_4210017 [Parafrankia sp. Ea1.12]